MEYGALLLFCATLIGCLLLDISILVALALGLLIFLGYGRLKGHGLPALINMALSGVKTIKNMLIIFILVGMLTALWRSAGTIPVIIYYSARLIHPSAFVLMAFLLNCGVSALIGTAFGTAATMGVICVTMAAPLGINPLFVGGAVLSGAYFGDRCSPVSTSALLIAELTGTDIYTNIRHMLRSALVPFLLSCGAYGLMGLLGTGGNAQGGLDVGAIFTRGFNLNAIALLPAGAILLLSALKMPVRSSMIVSIGIAFILSITLQRMALTEVLRLMLFGYSSGDGEIAQLLNGGGVMSMARVTAIVCLSSSYAGIFSGTGLLTHLKDAIAALSRRLTPFGATAITAQLAAMVACNQTLTIILTHQLCSDLEPDRGRFAIFLEDTAVVMASLVPWSIANVVPLTTSGAPSKSAIAACFLYLLPLWRLGVSVIKKRAVKKQRSTAT